MVLMTDARRDVAPLLPTAPTLLPADRDRAIARLSDAFARDVLPVEEFERRLDAVYRAGAPAELERVLSDLPNNMPASQLVLPVDRPTSTQRVRSVLSSVERRGFHDIPSRLELRATLANMELDLRNARFGSGITEISVHALFANIELMLPNGSRIYNEGTGILASFDCGDSELTNDDDGPIVRVTGWAVASNVAVSCAPMVTRGERGAPFHQAMHAPAPVAMLNDTATETPNPMPPYRP